MGTYSTRRHLGELKTLRMKAAFDEHGDAVKRQHEPQRIVGDRLNAEIKESRPARSSTSITTPKLPMAKDLGEFQFDGTTHQPDRGQ